jgi:hypothetical protein
MKKEKNTIPLSQSLVNWNVHEYVKHQRNKSWYVLAVIAGLLLLLYAILTKNFLFAIIIIIVAFIIVLHDKNEPDLIKINITDEGVIVGKKFFDYDEIKNFAVVYKPKQEVKNVYFEFKAALRQRLSIPLENTNPIQLREILLKYLPEDLDRTDLSLSESLSKIFKI